MKPDKLDKKIQEAAAQFEPVYNEQAWAGMKKILDEKMPQKKDKRKIFWIVFTFLLFLITGSLLFINYSGLDKQVAISPEKNTPVNLINNNNDSVSNRTITKANKSPNLIQPSLLNSSYKKLNQNTKRAEEKINKAAISKSPIPYKDLENKDRSTFKATNSEKNNSPEQQDNSMSAGTTKKDEPQANVTQPKGNEENNLLLKETKKSNSNKKINVLKKENKFINSFALNFSSGLDASGVDLGNIGKINLAYGAGISYQLNKRLTLRTGFYVEKKIYDAEVSDYHPPVRFWNYYPDLKYIDANCKIYEVPFIINYNFAQTKKHQWFGAVGLSSYFMKKEDYDFFSKNSAGQTSYNSYTINNKNRHYLSSVRLSAGYERKIKNNISILAEPYLNLPLNGVGYGKVKLYSTGVLVTLQVKPFTKKQ